MKSSTLEINENDRKSHVEAYYIHPEKQEQPLIRVYRNMEQEIYEAVFGLELSGIGRRTKSREEKSKENEIHVIQQERYKRLLLTGLSAGQTLDLEYTGGIKNGGTPYFKWLIKGRAQEGNGEEAAASVKQLWQNLNVIAGTLRNEYTFSPVADERKLGGLADPAGYVGVVNRVGVAINADTYVPMGFLRRTSSKADKSSVIVVPEQGGDRAPFFDSLALGALGCASEIKLALSISRIEMTDNNLHDISSALQWLRNGEAKQISFNQALKEGMQSDGLMASLENSLEQWIASPAGYRVSCTAYSREPIPMSFMNLVGSELFSGPFTVETRRIVNDCDIFNPPLDPRSTKAHIGAEMLRNDDHVLDLQDCVNSISLLPPLFPQVETLRKCNVKRSYVHAAAGLQQEGVLLGRLGDNAGATQVHFSKTDRSRHAYVIGATGTGKSTLLYNMIKQDIENGEGVCLIDPHGDLFEQVLRAVPKERAEDVVIVDPSDFDRSVGINFLETGDVNKNVQQNFVVNEMIKIFDRLYDLRTTGGPIFEQYMRNCLLLLMDNEYTEATLTDVSRVFEDRDFRRYLKQKCKNETVVSFWEKQAESAGGDASLSNVAPYITSKLNQFVNNALLRPIIGQPKSSINFRKIMDSGKILLVNLSKGMLGELDTQLLGMLIIGKLFSSAMGRVSLPPEKRRTMYLYIDEFQNFTTDSVAFLLSESRKFGLALTLANQNLAQLRTSSNHNDILDSVLGNVGSTFMLRLGILDAEVMHVYTKPELDAQDLQNQPDFHVAARMLNSNAPGKPFVFKTMPATSTVNPDLASKIKVLSRLKYAQDTSIVEIEIKRRRTSYKKEMKQSTEDE